MTSSRPLGHGATPAYDWIDHHANNRPEKEAVRDLGTDRSFTYADLDRRVDATAGYLRSIGVGRGDRVGVLAHNGVEFFDIQFACARIGAICVLLNWRLTVTELEYILSDSSPDLLVHDVEFGESAEELQRRCSIGELLQIDGGSPESAYESALARFDDEPVEREALTHADVITIMYTSGTTGLPKGAMITHGMNFWNCVNLGIPAGIGLDTVHLNVLPLFHTGGLNVFANPAFHFGGSNVVVHGFVPDETLRILTCLLYTSDAADE